MQEPPAGAARARTEPPQGIFTNKQQEKPSDTRCRGLGALCCLRRLDHFADDGKMVRFRGVTKMYASEQHAGDAAGMV